MTKIGDAAFAHCSALEEIRFPDTLAANGWRLFEDCNNLKRVYADWKHIDRFNVSRSTLKAIIVGFVVGRGEFMLSQDDEVALSLCISDHLSEFNELNFDIDEFIKLITDRNILCVEAATELLERCSSVENRAIILNYIEKHRRGDENFFLD